MDLNPGNMFQFPMGYNQLNQMNFNNQISMNNMVNNQMPMNNIMNSQIPMYNKMNNQMPMNYMMNIKSMNNNQMMMNQPNQIFPMQNQNILSNKIQINKEPIKLPSKINKKRKIPSILQKNANRTFENITFQVEKDLKPTDNKLWSGNPKELFRDLFKKRKKGLNQKGELGYINANEPLEILNYKFDTTNDFANYGKQSLMSGLAFAYGNHFPINVSPDMIWLLILQGYTRFMDKYSELVREKYVNFKGKKTLHINRLGTPLKSASDEVWEGLIEEFVEKISEHVGEETISNLQCDFTTTNSVTLLASQASIMSGMKNYFIYKGIFGICGISYITLEGSLEDWEKIKQKLIYISKFALNWWTKHLIPIIDNIIETKKYYEKNGKLNNKLYEFWKNMIKIKDKKGEYELDTFNGWIINFIPDLTGEHPKLYKELKDGDIPDQIISCPLELLDITFDGFKTKYNCDIHTGFFGVTQDKTTLTIKPVIGYAIVVDEKETSYPCPRTLCVLPSALGHRERTDID